jgi:kynureninase
VKAGLDRARSLDAADALTQYRRQFAAPDGCTYVDGNSLGLLSRGAERAVQDSLDEWRDLAIDGWLDADPAWFTMSEGLRVSMAKLVGALPHEVIVTGTTTVNLHNLVATFYRPRSGRTKIVATALDFPSDIYALQSQIDLHGGDCRSDLVRVPSRDGRTILERDIVAAMTDDVALVVLPTVLYRSGQLLDVECLTTAAHERGICVGFDAAHSVGAIPHNFHGCGVDFAFWCTYKYLNAGPAAPGALFVHESHHSLSPGLRGWWGSDKAVQFDMAHDFSPAPDAGRWQITAPPILSTAPLHASLDHFDEIGIDAIRYGSLARTDYLIEQISELGLRVAPYSFDIGTPFEHDRRGGHVAVEHVAAEQIVAALKRRGIVADYRLPNVIRIAPVALYNSFEDCWNVASGLKSSVDSGELGGSE